MSNEYAWFTTDPDEFRFVAGMENKSWDGRTGGYHRHPDYHLFPPKRIEMEMLGPEESVDSFTEVVKGYSEEQARLEADRCVECGICVATCPAHMDVPDYIRSIRDGDYAKGLKLMYRTNPFPATCGRICTRRCESVCPVGIQGEPVAIRWLKRFIVDQVPAEEYQRILNDQPGSSGRQVAVIGAGPGGMSAAFYASLAQRAEKAGMKDVLMDFSREEQRHKERLLAVKQGEHELTPEQNVVDLKITDYLVDVDASDDISYQDALIVAMKRERAAYRLYSDMAEKVPEGELKEVFVGLAKEEAKHKLFFESQYDERVLSDN